MKALCIWTPLSRPQKWLLGPTLLCRPGAALVLQVSNIIYLDSPAFVGLSYSRNETDAITNDLQTAKDTHVFLLKVSLFGVACDASLPSECF
jgi:hypothetical protein